MKIPTTAIKSSVAEKAILVYGAVLFLYLLVRSVATPPFYDESTTFFMYVQSGEFQPFYAHLNTNNHVLNSLLTRISYLIFGPEIWALRLPNVLSFLVYFYFLRKIATYYMAHRSSQLLFIVAMVSSPYLLDFFQVSRGYGLSVALLTGAVYYLIGYCRKISTWSLIKGCLFASLALWANLSLMVTIMVWGGLTAILLLFHMTAWSEYPEKGLNGLFRKWLPPIAVLLLLFALPLVHAIRYSLALKESGSLYLGNDMGITYNMIFDFMSYVSFGRYEWGQLLFIIVLIATGFGMGYLTIKKKWNATALVMTALYGGSLVGIFAMKKVMNINYPVGRAALHYLPLVLLAFYTVIDRIPGLRFRRLVWLPAGVLFIHLIFHLNFGHLHGIWKDDAVPEKFYDIIAAATSAGQTPPTVSTHTYTASTWNHYDYLHGGKLNSAQSEGYPSRAADWLITDPCVDGRSLHDYDTVAFRSATGIALMRPKHRPDRKLWANLSVEGRIDNSEYFNVAESVLDSSTGSSILVDMIVNLHADLNSQDVWLAVAVFDEDKQQQIRNIAVPLNRIVPSIRESTTIRRAQFLDNLPAGRKKVVVYLWNQHQLTISLEPSTVSVYHSLYPEGEGPIDMRPGCHPW
ncbi:MAG: hypothetical protein KDD36_09725 [Flavobacteriales bacterium]|nr:hypothetical protein [Flavobacteriales bacterium]